MERIVVAVVVALDCTAGGDLDAVDADVDRRIRVGDDSDDCSRGRLGARAISLIEKC